MKKQIYLLDTHTLIFWWLKHSISKSFIDFLDKQDKKGNLLVSSITFWEAALLAAKNKIQLDNDVEQWKNELLVNTNLILINPTASEMIESTKLPGYHHDPFDRLLIVQANRSNSILVSKDSLIKQYAVDVIWEENIKS